jgi:carbon starvation protein CstA
MISKVAVFKDVNLEMQINEIVNNQFAKYKEVTVTFTAANTVTKADVGFRATRYVVVDIDANINIWRDSSDERYAYMKASGAGTATIKFFKGE